MTSPRRRSHLEQPATTAPGHEVRVEDGRFTAATCSCGWQGAARRNRATARAEARDHALLYADGTELSVEAVPAPRQVADPAVERAAVDRADA